MLYHRTNLLTARTKITDCSNRIEPVIFHRTARFRLPDRRFREIYYQIKAPCKEARHNPLRLLSSSKSWIGTRRTDGEKHFPLDKRDKRRVSKLTEASCSPDEEHGDRILPGTPKAKLTAGNCMRQWWPVATWATRFPKGSDRHGNKQTRSLSCVLFK